ncbi:MAG: hypothetical protein Q9183_005938 [Haloplaca sp. 2 TL-2023]
MNVPAPRRVVVVNGQEFDPDHPRAARGYQAELDARREQERRDEELARRLQGMGMHDRPTGVEIYQVTDEQEDDGFGVGNGAGHHMNTNFVSYHAQPRPPVPVPIPEQPLLRQHSRASRAYNNRHSTRPAERVVPRRSATDYAHEAAVHAPLRSATAGVDGIRGSALAGLTRGGTAQGRVEEWRRTRALTLHASPRCLNQSTSHLKMSDFNLNEIHDFLVGLAQKAGPMITSANPSSVDTKKNCEAPTSDLVTETDKAVEDLISSSLKSAYPDYPCISPASSMWKLPADWYAIVSLAKKRPNLDG